MEEEQGGGRAMKIFVKTLKGTNFEIEVNPHDKVADVKRSIEATQGQSVYPADQQMLIHQGKVLKDDTTMEDNKVVENNFLVVMLTKAKGSSSAASTTAKAPANQIPPTEKVHAAPSVPAPAPSQAPAVAVEPAPANAPTPTAIAAPAPVVSIS